MIEKESSHDDQHDTGNRPETIAQVPSISSIIPPQQTVIAPQQASSNSGTENHAYQIDQAIEALEKPMGAFERRMLRATWVGIGLALITGVIFFLQFREMNKQTGMLREQAKQAAVDSAEAAKKVEQQLGIQQRQAISADNNVNAVRRQMRQDQRAWIDIGFGNLQWSVNTPVGIPVLMTNVGKTSAIKFRAVVVVEILTIDKPPDLGEELKVPAVADSAGIMTPHSFVTLKAQTLLVDPSDKTKAVPWNLGETDRLNLETGKTYWVAHGMLWYDDIFKTHHWRKFCTFGSPKVEILTPTRTCSDYNTVDNN